jgi:hypothetical protein
MKRINMKNSSGSEASVTFHIREDSLHSSPVYLSSSKQETFHLPSNKQTIRLSCGIGMWTPKAVAAFTDDLDSIVIRSKAGILHLTDSAKMNAYLLKNRRGLDRGKINIELQP